MRTILVIVLLVGATLPSTGCIVRSRSRGPVVVKEKRGCGPAHHWNGRACVHNGKHKGHNKHHR